jgi:hypothetical protein
VHRSSKRRGPRAANHIAVVRRYDEDRSAGPPASDQ